MEYYKFFRKKNAESIKDNYEIITPSKKELEELLRDKLAEKLQMIDVVFDKQIRERYLKRKNKVIERGITERQIQKQIGIRVLVDFYDLLDSLSRLKGVNLNKNTANKELLKTKTQIKNKMMEVVSMIGVRNHYEDYLNELEEALCSFANILEISHEEIQSEQKKIEEKEGSFFEGRIVKEKEKLFDNNKSNI